jgi:hypothetical protein
VTRLGETRNAYIIFSVKPLGKRQFRKSSTIWEDNFKMDIKEIGYETRRWMGGRYSVAGFDISGVQPSITATAILLTGFIVVVSSTLFSIDTLYVMHCYYMFRPTVAIIRYCSCLHSPFNYVCYTVCTKLCRRNNNNKHCLIHNMTLQYNITYWTIILWVVRKIYCLFMLNIRTG